MSKSYIDLIKISVGLLISNKSKIGEERIGIPLTGLTPPYFCACPKPRPRFPTFVIVPLFVFSERWLFILLIFVELLTTCSNFLLINCGKLALFLMAFHPIAEITRSSLYGLFKGRLVLWLWQGTVYNIHHTFIVLFICRSDHGSV